jgi:hypothetical protein
LNKDFLLALGTDFKRHGPQVIEKVRKTQPAAYLKICALLVPREMKLEQSGGVSAMTDEQLDAALEALRESRVGLRVVPPRTRPLRPPVYCIASTSPI